MTERVAGAFARHAGLVAGPPWFAGDHVIFVQKGVPAAALTAERLPELMASVTHTAADTPEIVDSPKLVEVAKAVIAALLSV